MKRATITLPDEQNPELQRRVLEAESRGTQM
jgi:hypothetical protein